MSTLDEKMTKLADAIRGRRATIIVFDGNIREYEVFSFTKPIPKGTLVKDITVTTSKNESFLGSFESPDIDYDLVSKKWFTDYLKTPITNLPRDLTSMSSMYSMHVKISYSTGSSTTSKLSIASMAKALGCTPNTASIAGAYTSLADAVRKTTNSTGKLSIDQMISKLGGS